MAKKISFVLIILSLFLVGCQGKNNNSGNEIGDENLEEIVISNMSDDSSRNEVETALKANLNEESVNNFINGVVDYNTTIENTSLISGFANQELPTYDVGKIISLWTAKKGNFIGTNCRINTFTLLKENISVGDIKDMDDSLLFLDKEAIEVGKLFDEADFDKFKKLFSKVNTEKTTDIAVHSKKMEEHFSDVKFNDNAKMISVIVHDNLDGDSLFVGHVGVMVENNGEYIFVEKLSFEEPFQALKFANKEDCFRYLAKKYEHYKDEGTVAPFIMENGKLAVY